MIKIILFVVTLLNFTASHAGFADLKKKLDTLKSQVPIEQSQDQPANPAQDPASQKADLAKPLNKIKDSSTSAERDDWMKNPYPDIPKSVSPEDIETVMFAAQNDIFKALNSPQLKSSYSICKSKELDRININIKAAAESAKNAKTNDERKSFLDIAEETEKIKVGASAATCNIRTVRRATLVLGIPYQGSQPTNSGLVIPADEGSHVAQIHQIAQGFNDKKFTDKFYSDLANELKYNHLVWMEEYILKPGQKTLDDLKKNMSKKDQAQADAGFQMGIARKVQRYDNLIMSYSTLISAKKITP
ncbi:hypothetical protein MCEMOHM34_00747 [Candidatus Methylopumilus universalis]|uniref:hypothetical protein n=1 Tax=Candidatus Methylopumilus universalis TaxID=2588536 RepID=UPI003BEEC112